MRRLILAKIKVAFFFVAIQNLFRKKQKGRERIVFLVNYPPAETVERYRTVNIVELLKKGGYTTELLVLEEMALMQAIGLGRCRTAVFCRCILTSIAEVIVDFLKKNGTTCVFEVDDWVIGRESMAGTPSSENMTKEQKSSREAAARKLDGYEAMLEKCEYSLTSTEYLRKHIETKFKKKTFIIDNGFNDEAVEVNDRLYEMRQLKLKSKDETVVIGYFSGSSTHTADFGVAQDALRKILKTYPFTRLVLVGKLDLFPIEVEFGERVTRKNFVAWRHMPEIIAEADVNIAPLASTSSFYQSKGTLKFLEAGILGIPTIATGTDIYKSMIQKGVTGFVVSNGDWYSPLEKLVTDVSLRESMGRQAREEILIKYTSRAQTQKVQDVFKSLGNTG